MPYEFKSHRRIQFADTDMAGIVHFANFFRYMEETEHAFYRSLGFAGHFNSHDEIIGWPRVSAQCDYKIPLRFQDIVEIHLLVKEKKDKSLLLDFIFQRQSDNGLQIVALGFLKIVCVRFSCKTGQMSSITIPSEIASQIEVAPSHLLKTP